MSKLILEQQKVGNPRKGKTKHVRSVYVNTKQNDFLKSLSPIQRKVFWSYINEEVNMLIAVKMLKALD